MQGFRNEISGVCHARRRRATQHRRDGPHRPIQPPWEEKTPDEIRALIRTTYGIDPAKTLDQMLYKRVAKGKTFYKTADDRFGLREFKSTTEEIRIPNTAAKPTTETVKGAWFSGPFCFG